MIIDFWAKARGEFPNTNFSSLTFRLLLLLAGVSLLPRCNTCSFPDELFETIWYLERVDGMEEGVYLDFQKQLAQDKLTFGEDTIPNEYIGYIDFEPNNKFVWNLQGLLVKGEWQCKDELMELSITEGGGQFLSSVYYFDSFEHYVLPSGISLATDQIEFVFFRKTKK